MVLFMLWNEAMGLATRQEQNHGRFDSHRYTVAPTHDRGHAYAQAGAQDSGSLHPRRLQAGRLPETLARHRQRGRSAALPAALGRSGELADHAECDPDWAEVLLRHHA